MGYIERRRIPLNRSGQAEFNAVRAVHHLTPCLSSSSRIDMPPRWSRRIAAYSSTFDIRA
ncbi:hypothetical protein KV205_26610 [Streptomyces sp. SKN60]|uniref:hypothetical protein n=1 Tax=Streptomyces sp. SKN60 TaxID=2855506 RepID=UPI002247D714|nr:hypothetical protein [Streptomyces sp. SKN60]MCX2184077.1 hypothetical protein [Streptomyces sp. SKN60]